MRAGARDSGLVERQAAKVWVGPGDMRGEGPLVYVHAFFLFMRAYRSLERGDGVGECSNMVY